MSGLFENLTMATNSLLIQRMGMDVVGQNMANINTPGYTRRSLELEALPPVDPFSAGRGVTVTEIRAMRDELVEGRLRREQSDTAHDAAMAEMIAAAEAAIGLPGQSLDAQLTALFDAFAALADDPTSMVARDTVIRQGRELSQAFADLSRNFSAIQSDADRAVRVAVTDVNAITEELARLNVDIAQSSYDADSIRDRQGVLLSELGKLTSIAVLPRADGGVDVALPSGRALVIGESAYPLETTADTVTAVRLGDADVTADFTGGRLGGLLQVRDSIIPGYTARLDQLAYDVATAVNALHATGYDLDGNAAGTFFAAPAAVAGAAFSLSVDAALLADSRRVAASATGAGGDNGIARSLSALRDATLANGGTRSANAAWSQIVYAVGGDAASARAAEHSHAQIVLQLEQMRAQVSGVSYDEEAANLMRYQRAYEANARYFTTILDTLDALMEMVR